MIRAEGRIVANDQDGVWVETARRAACGSCSSRLLCGRGLLALTASANQCRVQVEPGDFSPGELRVDDEVAITLPGGSLLAGVGLVYLLPLVLMVAGLLLGGVAGEGVAALAAMIGLGGGFLLLQLHNRRGSLAAYRPVITEVNPGRNSGSIPVAATD